MTSSTYRISILIPLYRSMRFIDNITRIIEENINSDYEFLLSDLHGFDDTIEVLKAKYSKKINVKFFKELSKKGWNENINLLIRNCTAKYFIIQPHDDYSPPERFKNLYDTIEKNPKTVLTFGSYKAVDLHDNLIKKRSYCPPNGIEKLSNWNTKTVMEMYWKDYFNGAFKGLVRRDLIINNQLYILPTKDLELADRCWLFGLGLIGSFQSDTIREVRIENAK